MTAVLIVAAVHLALDAPLYRPATLALYAVLAGLARPTPERHPCAPTGGWAPALVMIAAIALLTTGLRTVADVERASIADPIEARRAAQRWYPRAEIAGELARMLVAANRCREAEPELSYLHREAPAWTGPRELARTCAARLRAEPVTTSNGPGRSR
jgi:hypothetical protein